MTRTRFGFAVLSAALLAGCCSEPWKAYPTRLAPDESFSTGSGTHGYDVYVWHCVNRHRVIVYQYSSEMSCRGAERETAPCGGQTTWERLNATTVRLPQRPGREWR